MLAVLVISNILPAFKIICLSRSVCVEGVLIYGTMAPKIQAPHKHN